MSAIDSLQKAIHETPISPCIDVLANGTLIDLLDATHRGSNPRICCVWAWIDSVIAHFSTAFMSCMRLVHDFVLALIFSPTWLCCDAGKMTCKIFLYRSAIDLIGILAGVAGTFYPPLGYSIFKYVFCPTPEKEQDIAMVLDKIHGEICSKGSWAERFF